MNKCTFTALSAIHLLPQKRAHFRKTKTDSIRSPAHLWQRPKPELLQKEPEVHIAFKALKIQPMDTLMG